MKKYILALLGVVFVCSVYFAQEMSESVMISDTPPDSSKWAQAAFGPDGKVHIIWAEDFSNSRGDDIFYVAYDGLNVGNPANLTNSRLVGAERPYICTSRQGGIFIVYDQEGQCHLIEYDPEEERWLDPFRVSPQGYGGGEPACAADPDGNIYVIWFAEVGSRAYSRARINGEWEDVIRLSSQRRSTQVGMAAGNDGQVWAIWREKQPNREYKIFYRKRTKNSQWSPIKPMNLSGASQAHPHLAVGPDNIPVVTYADVDVGEKKELWICTIDENTNPREMIVPVGNHHYSRIAIDNQGNKHVAWQIGPGDHGRGVRYMNNVGGNWNPSEVLPNSGGSPKLPGISADAGGNVAVVWSSAIPGRDKEVWLSSLYPIVVLYPPSNLGLNISISNLKETPEIGYDLSWEPNPDNDQEYVKGYNIYKKEGDGEFEFLLSVNESTLTASFTFTGAETRRQFGIKTVSTYDTEGPLAIFGIDE